MGLKDRIASERRDGASTGDGVSFYRRRLLEEVDLSEFAELSAPQRRARLERVVGRMVSREGPVLSTTERTRLIRQVIDEAIGLGVLEPLLADPTVTEIMVNGVDEVYVERDGRLQRSEIAFTDEAQLYQTIDRIVSQVNRRVDESSPMVDARLPTGERVNVIIPPLALKGPTLTIRRFPRLFTLDQLVGMESIDADSVTLLRALVKARLNVVISGGTGAGKTTLLNALSAAVPRDGADHHRRGQRGAAPAAAARRHARGAPVQRRGPRRDLDPRPRAQLAAHAPRPDHRRRGPRRRDARHAPGAQHGPRGLAGDRARQLLRRRDPPPRDAGDDERPAHPVRGAARPDQLRDPRDRADRPLRRRRAPHLRDRRRRLRAPRGLPARHGRALRDRPDRAGPQGDRRASGTSRCRPASPSTCACRASPCPPSSARPPRPTHTPERKAT